MAGSTYNLSSRNVEYQIRNSNNKVQKNTFQTFLGYSIAVMKREIKVKI